MCGFVCAYPREGRTLLSRKSQENLILSQRKSGCVCVGTLFMRLVSFQIKTLSGERKVPRDIQPLSRLWIRNLLRLGGHRKSVQIPLLYCKVQCSPVLAPLQVLPRNLLERADVS